MKIIFIILMAVALGRPFVQAEMRSLAFPGTDVDGIPKVALHAPVESLRLLPDFYQTPQMPFVFTPGEQVVSMKLGSSTGAEAQRLLDSARAVATQAVFVVTLEGVISISDVALAPKARTCFIFSKGARIVAAPKGTARELILIKETEYVSFQSEDGAQRSEGCILDGANRGVTGIRVENSGRVFLDGLAIMRCGAGGVNIVGRGLDHYTDGVSLTRSSVTECGANGVTVRKSTQFIALDNRITNNHGTGLDIESPASILANNICAANAIGVSVFSCDNTLTRNQLIANGTGVVLRAESEFTLVYENAIQDNQLGTELCGKTATIGWNRFANRTQLTCGGKNNLLQSNTGLSVTDVTAPGTAYFNPPTISNPHTEKVIWKGSGEKDLTMERCDITIEAGTTMMDVKDVTVRLLDARHANPTKVIVATLAGRFVVRTKEGLKIPDHTCVLLSGTITNETSEEQRDQLVSMTGKGCVSFSGGKLFSASKVYDGFTGMGGNNVFLLDGVQINLDAVDAHTGTKSVNAINAKKHAGAFMVRGCEVRNPGHRGVWAHVSSRVYTLGNRFYAGGMTIDFDAYCHHSVALYNTISDAMYHSAIFFEEAVKYNTAFANTCFSNNTAIAIHNQEVTGVTEYNTIACNRLFDNGLKGGADLGIGGSSATNRADRNYVFNTQISRNHGRGAINLKGNAKDNVIVQSVLIDCPTPIANWSTKPFSHGYGSNMGFVGASISAP
jgi:hypothetical protein